MRRWVAAAGVVAAMLVITSAAYGGVPDSLKAHLYWSTAVQILRSLCEKHLAKGDPKWEGILKGGVYHVHKGLGVDESVMWGEYFFLEALDAALGL